jgi:hypothetical protein
LLKQIPGGQLRMVHSQTGSARWGHIAEVPDFWRGSADQSSGGHLGKPAAIAAARAF